MYYRTDGRLKRLDLSSVRKVLAVDLPKEGMLYLQDTLNLGLVVFSVLLWQRGFEVSTAPGLRY